MSRSDMVHELIMERSEVLSKQELDRIVKKYFNLSKSLLLAARKAKEIQKGEWVDMKKHLNFVNAMQTKERKEQEKEESKTES